MTFCCLWLVVTSFHLQRKQSLWSSYCLLWVEAQASHASLYCRVAGGEHCNNVVSLPLFFFSNTSVLHVRLLSARCWLTRALRLKSISSHPHLFSCLLSTFQTFLQHDARSTPHTYGINVLGAAAVKANSDFSKASSGEMRCRMRNGTYGRIEKSACEALQWSVRELKLWEGIMGELLGWLWICYGKRRSYRTGRRSPPPLNHAGSGGKTSQSPIWVLSKCIKSKTLHSVILTMAISLSIFSIVVLVSGSLCSACTLSILSAQLAYITRILHFKATGILSNLFF